MSMDPAPAPSRPNGGEGFVGEATSVWTCAYEAWSDYLGRLSTAGSPLALFAAGAQLMNDSLQISGRATAKSLQDAGLASPLLNDA
ncbi:hypothetical protein [Phenylobacterium immobile]|uniref:hypothetical protein n=1 Tax=Phenylobacterium immobile TaxID=21 RepID=UPI000A7CECF7|nr:hypothetical protein [Phenylobacterium immobile]